MLSVKMVLCLCLLLVTGTWSAKLLYLDVSSDDTLSKDVVMSGQVQGRWQLHNAESSLIIDKSSYLQFYVAYPGGGLHLTAHTVEGNSTQPLLYDKVPEATDQPSAELDLQLCDE